jgi:hypothetical protein
MTPCFGAAPPFHIAISVVRDDCECVEMWSFCFESVCSDTSHQVTVPQPAKRAHISSPSTEVFPKRPRHQAEAELQSGECLSVQYINLTRCVSCQERESTGQGRDQTIIFEGKSVLL